MSGKNIQYKTKQISEYFSVNRVKWDQFYPSEKWIFERVAGPDGQIGRVLDAGCAAGGLGLALGERFSLSEYVGVDINVPAIEFANNRRTKYSCPCDFLCGDILEINTLQAEGFDNVFSLSCADWNIRTEDIINRCWNYVRRGGNFVLTLRLTPEASLCNFSESFQYICSGNQLPESTTGLERAQYVVFNAREAFSLLASLQPRPTGITAYGYWGTPSSTARTRYNRLVFAAISVRKGLPEEVSPEITGEFHLPVDLLL